VPMKKKGQIPKLIVAANATRRQIYAKLRREFTAGDLQKFTELEPSVPAEKLVAQLEAIHRAETSKRRKP
jgi:hypothetical protein